MNENSSNSFNRTSNSTMSNNKYTVSLADQIHAIIVLLIIMFGLVGNVVSLIIYRRKVFKKQSIGLYLSIISFLNLVIVLNPLEILHINAIQFKWMKNDYYCKTYTLLHNINFQYSSWVLVLNSIDHILTIQIRGTCLKKRSNQILALVFVLVSLFLINIPLIINSYFDPNESTCTINAKKSYLIDVIDMTMSTLIPFILMLISTIIILIRLFKWKSDCYFAQSVNERRRITRKKQFARTVVCFNLLFLACNLPNSIIMVIFNYKVSIISSASSYMETEKIETQKLYKFHSVFITILYSYNASFLIVSLFSNKIFQQEFLKLFCNKRTPQPVFFT